ncbi:ferrous iron transport protein B [Desulfobacca acetoxidans]|nr:ferrous iron transport protein B [Desulfobacterales bacterium]
MAKTLTVALAGNPNVGKTALFNNLTGARQHVANWPGVTVEKKEGKVYFGDYEITIIDLPGTYSLSPFSLEEIIARNFIVDEKPDVVINVIDASNLERNLFLSAQIIDLGAKMVFALNMVDTAASRGIQIDQARLAELWGVPVAPTVANRNQGTKELIEAVIRTAEARDPVSRHIHIDYGSDVEAALIKIEAVLARDPNLAGGHYPRWLATKLLELDPDVIRRLEQSPQRSQVIAQVEESRRQLEKTWGEDASVLVAERRYGFLGGTVREVQRQELARRVVLSEQVDKVLTHQLFGFPFFLFFIWLLFQMTFTLGEQPTEWIQAGVGWLKGVAQAQIADVWLRNLVADGIIAGVGSVLVFLPQITLLFLGISFLDDTGYMARVAFIMDRIMHALGLHGKSFIPMLMGFGCNVPAIMATRGLSSHRDRVLTMLLVPLMSCSARLPVYVLFAGVFFPKRAGQVIFGLYLLGIVMSVLLGMLFSRFLLKGQEEPFVMELPPYRLPALRGLIVHMWDRVTVYLKRMGTVILIASIVIWFLGAYPKNQQLIASFEQEKNQVEARFEVQAKALRDNPNFTTLNDKLIQEKEAALTELTQRQKAEEMRQTFIGRLGAAFEPLMQPLGFDWRMSVSLVTGFVAKEIVVSTMGVLYGVGETADEASESLQQAIKASGLSAAAALAFMVFVLLYTPCLATVVTLWRESGSLGWMWFSLGYQLLLAWTAAWAVVRLGRVLGLG